jgi:hypothetical protein
MVSFLLEYIYLLYNIIYPIVFNLFVFSWTEYYISLTFLTFLIVW